MVGFALKGPPKWGFWRYWGQGQRYLVEKYIRLQKCAFSDIVGPYLTRRDRVVVFCMGIPICHRHKFGQVWGDPISPTRSRRKTALLEGTLLDLRLPHGKIDIIL